MKNGRTILLLLVATGALLALVGTYLLGRGSRLTLKQILDPLPGNPNSQTSTPVSSPNVPTVSPLQPAPTGSSSPSGAGVITNNSEESLSFPIRAAFYYPWFPEAWNQSGMNPYTVYTPTLGFYNSSDQLIIHQHIDAMLYGNIQAGIASWWGPGSPTDQRFQALLSAAAGTHFKWAIYYEGEGIGDPDVNTMTSDLAYIRDHYSNDPNYLHIDDRFVVFVYGNSTDGCSTVDRWKQANTVNAYLVVKIFPNYLNCTSQPDSWHQYAPSKSEISSGQFSYTISPGEWKPGGDPQLARDLQVWKQSIENMVASGADFQLITSFNEWGEGTAVEPAIQWSTASGYGAYLDALHEIPTNYVGFLPTVIAQQGNTDPILLAAGDIAACGSPGDEETAALLKAIPGTIAALGDNAYESGTDSDYATCYDPTWGQFKDKTFPAAGNHDYLTLGASGYYKYYGKAAGDPTKGYYSYDLGTWHIIVLNANCSEVGGCDLKSPQLAWLTADLADHANLCTLAYWHQPRFSSGTHGDNPRVGAFWQVLYQAGVELVLNGHDHDYERFAPQNPDGLADPAKGIREFVVGTGGKNLTSKGSTDANSEVYNDNTWGVLELSLHPSSYDWKFLPVAGEKFTDSGNADCH